MVERVNRLWTTPLLTRFTMIICRRSMQCAFCKRLCTSGKNTVKHFSTTPEILNDQDGSKDKASVLQLRQPKHVKLQLESTAGAYRDGGASIVSFHLFDRCRWSANCDLSRVIVCTLSSSFLSHLECPRALPAGVYDDSVENCLDIDEEEYPRHCLTVYGCP